MTRGSYSQHYTENLIQLSLDDSTILLVNLQLEYERVERMRGLLLSHGRMFSNSSFDTSFQPADKTTRCYDGAVALAKKSGLIYVEGVVFIARGPKLYPLAHGWCCTSHGEIVDPTLSQHQHKDWLHYTGIPIKMDYVDAQYEETGYYGLLDGRPDEAPKGIHYDDPTLWCEDI
jgi:hypothetical protein